MWRQRPWQKSTWQPTAKVDKQKPKINTGIKLFNKL
jgi:hypothetical protein